MTTEKKPFDRTAYSREYMRKYRKEKPEVTRRANAAWYARNREGQKARSREAYHKVRWPSHLKRKYGITPQQYDAMHSAQGGCCAICKGAEPGGRTKRFHVDHCHQTGKVRQLLCNACNHLLGCARDRSDVLRAAADYLTRHQELV